jgi:uncharacterized membrane protein
VPHQLARLVDRLRNSFWFLPAVLMLAAAVAAWLALAADGAHDGTWGGVLYNGGPDGARVLLGTIAGSMVTVGTTVFSITMVALTLASSQFGPRMLSNFLRDRGNQFTIGLFVAIFLYCLLVMRGVRNDTGGVPNLAVSLAIVLAVGALMVLVYFIHHIATSIQVMNLLQVLAEDLAAGLDSTVPARPDPTSGAVSPEARPEGDGPGVPVPATLSGYVQYVDYDGLVASATRLGLLVEVGVRPGRFVVAETPVARVWSADGSPAASADLGTLSGLVGLGHQRSVVQDVEFPIRQLVEVGLRALSPGINDPTTATACVNQLSVGLCRVADRPMPPDALADGEGAVRVVQADPLTFDRLVGVSFDQLRQAAADHVVVYLHLLEALTTVAGCTRRADRLAAVRHQGDLVWERASRAVVQPADLQVVRARYDALLLAVGADR